MLNGSGSGCVKWVRLQGVLNGSGFRLQGVLNGSGFRLQGVLNGSGSTLEQEQMRRSVDGEVDSVTGREKM